VSIALTQTKHIKKLSNPYQNAYYSGRFYSVTKNSRKAYKYFKITHARKLVSAHYSIVYLLDRQTQILRSRVTNGDYADAIKSTEFQLGEGLVGLVAQQGVEKITLHTQHSPHAFYIPGHSQIPQSLACAPLIYADTVIGVIALARLEKQGPFVQADLDLLMRLTPPAAAAIEHARLYVSERAHAAELSQALKQQKALARMKDQFIQSVLHELRAPLTIARGYAELLECEDPDHLSTEYPNALKIIARRLRMLGELIKDLNTLLNVKNKEKEFAFVDFSAKVRDSALDFALVAAEAKLTVNITAADNCAPVWGDCIHLRRVLDNLVSNAIKSTPAGGRIDVTVKQEHNTLILTVSDTGIGIPADQLDRIFERFYQVKEGLSRRYDGVGLGLSLVKTIVEAHKGHINVHSTVGQGSTFIVKLPTMIQD